MRPVTKADRELIYEYVLFYVDDILAISFDPKGILTELKDKYMLKPGSIKRPNQYLGAQIKAWHINSSADSKKLDLLRSQS